MNVLQIFIYCRGHELWWAEKRPLSPSSFSTLLASKVHLPTLINMRIKLPPYGYQNLLLTVNGARDGQLLPLGCWALG